MDGNSGRLLPNADDGQGSSRVNYLGEQKSRELLDLKTKWGFTDARLTNGAENCESVPTDVFRSSWQETGVSRKAFDARDPIKPFNPNASSSSSSNGGFLSSLGEYRFVGFGRQSWHERSRSTCQGDHRTRVGGVEQVVNFPGGKLFGFGNPFTSILDFAS